MSDLLIATRAIQFAASGLTAGAMFFLLFVGGPALHGPEGPRPAIAVLLRTRVLRLAWIGLAGVLISAAAWVLLQSAAMSGTPLAEVISDGVAWTVLTETHFGIVADIRLLIALCLAAALISVGTSRLSLWSAAALAAALLATVAFTGHAAGTPGLAGAVHLGADALHLLAAGAWVGGLLPLSLVLITARAQADAIWHRIARAATLRFSALGVVSVGTLLVTGAVNTWILAGSVPALIGTDYGRLLLAKIAIFAAMVALAAVNRFRLTPLLSDQGQPGNEAMRRLARNAGAEFVLGLAIFAVVGALGTLPPGLHMQPEWPLRFRLSTDILADPDLGPRAFLALFAAVAGIALILVGFFATTRRRLWIIGSIFLILSFAGDPTGFFERAYPTTFYASPTGYSADSIAQGHRIFAENCAQCHGATGRGDGPAAAQAQRKPADLTADHIYAHRDGDLFWWITDGIAAAMPAFRDVLDETARWNVIDFVHANADVARLRASAAQVRAIGFPAPSFSATCRDGAAASLEDLRGSVVHVVLAPGESVEWMKGILDRDRLLGVTTIFAVSVPIEGIDGIACVTDDPLLREVMAIYGGTDAGRTGRVEWLIDASGLLRSMSSSLEAVRGGWADPEVFGEAVREVRQQPAAPQHPSGHLHH